MPLLTGKGRQQADREGDKLNRTVARLCRIDPTGSRADGYLDQLSQRQAGKARSEQASGN